MATKKDGGQAFPCAPGGTGEEFEPGAEGMTLRDYFAGQALNGFFSSPAWMKGADAAALKSDAKLADALAEFAYQYADAMIAEREKTR